LLFRCSLCRRRRFLAGTSRLGLQLLLLRFRLLDIQVVIGGLFHQRQSSIVRVQSASGQTATCGSRSSVSFFFFQPSPTLLVILIFLHWLILPSASGQDL
jgi:hypothetical protein